MSAPVEAKGEAESEASDPETTDALTSLLIGMTRSEVDELRASVHREDQFAGRVSTVLGEAIELADSDPRLKASLGAVTQRSVLDIAQRQPDKLGDAIAPAMGPAIRGMVALSLADLNERVESIIQQSFSLQGLKWRLESMRTGTPLADIVLRDTLTYRVEHALLIHRSSGTLLNHAMQPEYEGKDPATVAAMLTAVKHFLEDAFEPSDQGSDAESGAIDSLENQGELSHQFSAGDTSIVVKAAGELALAVVVRGTRSAKLERLMSLALEGLLDVYGNQALSFDGDVERFSGSLTMLEDCLFSEQAKATQAQTDSEKGRLKTVRKYLPAIAVGLLVAALLGWQSHSQTQRWHSFVQALEQQPGVIVSSSLRLDDESAAIGGLRDPDAVDLTAIAGQFGFANVDWQLQSFLSLEPSVTLARARRILSPPATINLRFDGDTIRATGRARAEWLESVSKVQVPGVARVDVTRVLPPALI